MDIKIVDTTLRDGEQKAGIALSIKDKIQIAKILDKVGIYQIEAGIPSMGGDEKKSIKNIVELGLKSKISTWNRMNIEDINDSIDCGVDIIHISVPSSDVQIKSKLNKDKHWIVENVRRCISYVKNKSIEVTIGFEDASRADINFLINLSNIAKKEGADRIRYADTVGILYPKRTYEEIKRIKAETGIEIGIHAHNDFGMAIANSIAAVKGGAKYIDCTFGGIGERTGNCNFNDFILVAKEMLNYKTKIQVDDILKAEIDIMNIVSLPRKSLPIAFE
ncbi:2-isopropylmalate synthase [Clostridium homopropionicum DSM 5847]|uniref:2-isopropylmalate synthase n=1 Tax=Clostridium homopropionicum DSM 5847 TaxID=1121318 RepID=A0A0L6ZE00_9CLOT|nr:homocitrate synthase [Clostridium homopropionicum]KOA21196.1 2-isopropylmalate synthase [Clostridium homopropionicum DSM 5847]SFG26872.1 homocitrate synthase NifV [Clostridium homopropionicum]